MKQPIPEVGKIYNFYDDGKLSHTRQFKAKVLKMISTEEAKNIQLSNDDSELDKHETLFDGWMESIKDCSHNGEPWLYDTQTDYFIECSIAEYDKDPIWFVRTIHGGWFSMDITGFWQSGALDVDGSLTEEMEKAYAK